MMKFLGDFGSKKVYQISKDAWILKQDGKLVDTFSSKIEFEHWKLYSGFKERK